MTKVMHCPAPRTFKAAGVVEWAAPAETPPVFAKRKRRTGRRALGVKYEARGHEYLDELYGHKYIASPWFRFKSEGQSPRWCQADGLLLDPTNGVVTIIEFKYQHTSDAWWQLRMLYSPVVRYCFSGWETRVCEIVKWYDPAVVYPEEVKLVRYPDLVPAGQFGVHIYKP